VTAASVTASSTSSPSVEAASSTTLSVSAAEAGAASEDQPPLETADDDNQQVYDETENVIQAETEQVQADDDVVDESKDIDSTAAVSHEADVDVTDDSRHGDEEQQSPCPESTDDIQPPTLTPSNDEVIISPVQGDVAVTAETCDGPGAQQSVASDDRIDDTLLSDEVADAIATPVAADEDHVTDEPQSVQPLLTQAKPDLKYQYSEGLWLSVSLTHTQLSSHLP